MDREQSSTESWNSPEMNPQSTPSTVTDAPHSKSSPTICGMLDRMLVPAAKVLIVLMGIELITMKALWNIAFTRNMTTIFGYEKHFYNYAADIGQCIMCVCALILYFHMTVPRKSDQKHQMWRIMKNTDRFWLTLGVSGVLLVSIMYFVNGIIVWGAVMFCISTFVLIPALCEIGDFRRYDQVVLEDWSYMFFGVTNIMTYLAFVNDAIVTPNEIVRVTKAESIQMTEYSSGMVWFVIAIVCRIFLFAFLLRNFVRAWELRWLSMSEGETKMYNNLHSGRSSMSPFDRVASNSSRLSEDLSYTKKKGDLKFILALIVLVFFIAQFFVKNPWYWFIRGAAFIVMDVFVIVWGLKMMHDRRDRFKPRMSWTWVFFIGKVCYGGLSFMYELNFGRCTWYRAPACAEWGGTNALACFVICLNLTCTIVGPSPTYDQEDEEVVSDAEIEPSATGISNDIENELSHSRPCCCSRLLGFRAFLVASQIYNQIALWRVILDTVFVTMLIYSEPKIDINLWSRLMFCVSMVVMEFHVEMIKMARVIDEIMHNEKMNWCSAVDARSLGGTTAESFVLGSLLKLGSARREPEEYPVVEEDDDDFEHDDDDGPDVPVPEQDEMLLADS